MKYMVVPQCYSYLQIELQYDKRLGMLWLTKQTIARNMRITVTPATTATGNHISWYTARSISGVSCNDWKKFHEKSNNILSWLTAASWINKAEPTFDSLKLKPWLTWTSHWPSQNWFLISPGFPSNITVILPSVNLMNLLITQGALIPNSW